METTECDPAAYRSERAKRIEALLEALPAGPAGIFDIGPEGKPLPAGESGKIDRNAVKAAWERSQGAGR